MADKKNWFRPDYCLKEEMVAECPVCHTLLLEGPGMSQKEKAVRSAAGKKARKNLPKHLCAHASENKREFTPSSWKMWDNDKQIDWIMETATEYLKEKAIDPKKINYYEVD